MNHEPTYTVRGRTQGWAHQRWRPGAFYTLRQIKDKARHENVIVTDGYGRTRFSQARRLYVVNHKGTRLACFVVNSELAKPESIEEPAPLSPRSKLFAALKLPQPNV